MVVALLAAGLSVAAHVLGKAVRDTLYLATFPVEALPYFVIGTGLVSGFLVSGYTRLTAAFSPGRVVPALAAGSALLSPLFYLGARTGSGLAVALLYGFTTVSAGLLVSGFWAVLGERFDPRAARQIIGLVGAATTVGGLVGGLGAHVLLRVMEAEALMLPLGVVNGLLALALVKLAPSSSRDPGEPDKRRPSGGEARARPGGLIAGVRDILASRYLRNMALLVGALTMAGTLADYVFKDAAAQSLHGKRELAEFFSLFYGAVGAITLGVQVFVCRPLVARKGLGAALVALPAWLGLGAALVIIAPVLWAATALRAGENAVRNSFHRAGYELLFVPLPPLEKRVTKPILDTLLDRLADGLGAGLVLLLVTAIGMPAARLGWLVVALAAAAAWLVVRVRRGYVETLSASLVARAVELEEVVRAADDDATAREALRETLLDARQTGLRSSMQKSKLGLSLMRSLHMELPKEIEALRKAHSQSQQGLGAPDSSGVGAAVPAEAGLAGAAPAQSRRSIVPEDPVLALLRQLADPDSSLASAAIHRWDGRDKRVVPFLARLLGRDATHKEAAAALSRAGDRIAGALADHLTDLDEDFAVRRRIPRVLSSCRGPTAIDALVCALSDRRFEVRYHAAVALERISAAGGPKAPAEPIWSAIREEVRKSRSMWEAQRLLEEPDEPKDDDAAVEAPVATDRSGAAAVVEQRGAHSLRHVFRLLGLVLDPKPLELCYRALGAGDLQFRAVSLEYLENVLPPDVRRALWPLIGDDPELPPVSQTGRALEAVMKELATSGMNLALTMDRPDPPLTAALKAAGSTMPPPRKA